MQLLVSLGHSHLTLLSPILHHQRSSHYGTGTLILTHRFFGNCAKGGKRVDGDDLLL